MTDDQNPFAATIPDEELTREPLLYSVLRAIGIGVAAWFVCFLVVNVLSPFPMGLFRLDADWLNTWLSIAFFYAPFCVAVSAGWVHFLRSRRPTK